jgi:zinc and cadmium transporter
VTEVLPSTVLALIAASSLVFGSAIPTLPLLRTRLFASRLSLLIGFSAGLMLATALHELLPASLEANPHYAMWGASLGFMSLYIAERWTHFHACRHLRCDVEDEDDVETQEIDHHAGHEHAHSHAHAHSHSHSHAHSHTHGHADTMALVGMSIHNFADGLTVAAAFAVSHTIGAIVVFAVVLHQMAAGLSLSAIMLRLGRSHRRVLTATTIVASFIVAGALFYFWVVPVGETVQGFILGIAAGSFLYVAACDLLPEAHAADEGWAITAMTLVGYGFALLAKQIIEPGGH